jgi:hypothetical protein
VIVLGLDAVRSSAKVENLYGRDSLQYVPDRALAHNNKTGLGYLSSEEKTGAAIQIVFSASHPSMSNQASVLESFLRGKNLTNSVYVVQRFGPYTATAKQLRMH